MVFSGGGAWLFWGRACVVFSGGSAWFFQGGHAWFFRGGHVWFFGGGVCFFPGGGCAYFFPRGVCASGCGGCMLLGAGGDTVNERAVRILLECILVLTLFSAVLRRGYGEPSGGSEGLWESIALHISVRAWGRVLVDYPLSYSLHDWHGGEWLMARSKLYTMETRLSGPPSFSSNLFVNSCFCGYGLETTPPLQDRLSFVAFLQAVKSGLTKEAFWLIVTLYPKHFSHRFILPSLHAKNNYYY